MTHTRTRFGIAALALSFALTTTHASAEEQLVFEFDSLRQFVARTLVFDADDRGGDIVLQFGTTLNKTLRYDSIRGIFRFNDDLWISGTASGTYVHAEHGLSSSGTLVFEGAASGSSLYLGTSLQGAGLADCDTGATSKLLWDSSTGRFSCGTDQSGGSFGSGNVITIGDGRYVNVSGDTMTGALAIQNGNTHSATTTPLINVRGTMSGRSLFITGTGGSARPLIATNIVSGRVGIGTSNPADLLTVSGGGIWTTGAVRDAFGWGTNTRNKAKLSLGMDMGGLGGTTTNPGRTFTLSGSWATYDPGANGVGIDPDGYEGAAFDGRYIYFAPADATGAAGMHSEVLRYDTTQAFNTTTAWTTFDPGTVGVGTDGYSGIVFDGQYMYFVPAYNGAYHGTVMRYNTHGDFKSAESWASYDAGSNGVGTDPDGYWGGLFDGRYVYFIPDNNGTARHGEVMRYDTTGGFTTKGSWTTYDPGANGVGSDPDGYIGGTFDGRYIYLAPYNNGTAEHGEVLRYDTTGAFHATGSWSTFDAGANGVGTDPDGFFGAVYDGRYVYFTPHDPGASNGGEVLRYDTASTFAAASSWTTYDPGANGLGSDLDGFYGSYFDGRYVYFSQYHNGSANAGEMMRYDSTQPFNAIASWEVFDPGANKVGTDPDGYGCIVSDGRFLYYCPVHNGTSAHGEVLRFDTGSPAPEPSVSHLAKSRDLFIGSGSNAFVGIGTNTPMAKLAVSGSAIFGLNVGGVRPDARLEVIGAISGSVLYGKDALRSSGSLVFEGAASGSSLYLGTSLQGAGLADCDTAATSKLLWDSSTGRFSCGTDQTGAGGSFGSGNVITIGDGRYVNVSGDTMTGALTIDITGSGNGTGLILRERAFLGSGATMSGAFVFLSRADAPRAESGAVAVYAKNVSGKPQIYSRTASGAPAAFQPSFADKRIMILMTGGGTTVNGVGTTVTNDTTVSHPTPTEKFGYMTNFATSTVSGDEAGTSSAVTAWFRGSGSGSNGMYFKSRIAVIENTSIRLYNGMADQTIATMVGADAPTGSHMGFQFSTPRGDTTWQFETRNGSTQTLMNTGMTVLGGRVYDMIFYCTAQCTSVTWRIENVTDGTVAQGTVTATLPPGGTALRMLLGVETQTGAARNVRMRQIYVEAEQ